MFARDVSDGDKENYWPFTKTSDSRKNSPVRVDQIRRETGQYPWEALQLKVDRLEIKDSPLFGKTRSKEFATKYGGDVNQNVVELTGSYLTQGS